LKVEEQKEGSRTLRSGRQVKNNIIKDSLENDEDE
jgi:hypothetical protein